MIRWWWVVTYFVPETGQWVKQVEWMSHEEALVKGRATGQPPRMVTVRDMDNMLVKGVD